MKTLLSIAVGLVAAGTLVVPAMATIFEYEQFNADWTMGTEWEVDRTLPAHVDAQDFDGDSRLRLGLRPPASPDSWHRWEGIKHEVTMPEWGYQSFSIDMYVGNDWGVTDRAAGMWGQGMDGASISAWPIISYRNSETTAAGFYSFDYLVGGWVDRILISPSINPRPLAV